MASLPILTALAVETQGDQTTIVLTVKGTPKVPESVSVEGAGRGLKTIKFDQNDEATVYAVGAAVRIEGDVEVTEEDGDFVNWFKDNFVPTSNGGGFEAEAENGAAQEEPAEAPEESFTPTEEDQPEEKPVANKKTKSKPAAAKASTKAKPAAVKQAKAETKAAAKGKAAAATKKVAAPKATKAPREPKPERAEYNTEAIDKALLAFAKEHGIRVTHVIVKRSLQLIQEDGSKIVMGEMPAESKTIGVIPGQTYEVQKEHKQYGTCDYKVQVLKDKTIKLVAFKGNDGGRKLKVGTVYPHAKALLKQVLQLTDPHVSFYKFFNL